MLLKHRKIIQTLFIVIVLVGLGAGLFFAIKYRKSGPTAEQKYFKSISQEVAKTTFDLDGVFISYDEKSKSLELKVSSGSTNVKKYQNKELKLVISDQTIVLDNSGNQIQLSNLSKDQNINIKGKLSGKDLQAELIISM